MNKLAKALYDNTAECADELAFRKGDILTVTDQNVAGTSGWWMCSLYGRRGLAPANRLKLLPRDGPAVAPSSRGAEVLAGTRVKSERSEQIIYQTPSVPAPAAAGPAYEHMDMIYQVPFAQLPSLKSQMSSALQLSTEGLEGNKPPYVDMARSPKGEVYDVPSPARRTSLVNESTIPRQTPRKSSLVPMLDLEKRFEHLEIRRCSSPGNTYVYAVSPPQSQDPNYDIPIPSVAESHQKLVGGYRTLPTPRKPEWIYDVPVGPDKHSPPQGPADPTPSESVCRQIYDTLPAHTLPLHKDNPASLLYDIPKQSSLEIPSPPRMLPRIPLNNKTPAQAHTEESVYAVPPKEEPLTQVISRPPNDHKPLECRGDSSQTFELKRLRLKRMRNFLACTSFHDLPESGDPLGQEDEPSQGLRLSTADSQRISTASSSSTSSCDSLALSSSSPEPLRELTLSQEEACRGLLDLQESVCKAVPKLMMFVSSHWRCKAHLEKHLTEIKEAAEGVACAVTGFLNFALDVKGNARRLTDANLQARLCKQLSVVEDSGVILQQTVSALNVAKWPLHTLCQDPEQAHAPDQLERFVMVARTVPEDVKRLVSIVNANGKLLFRAPQRDAEAATAAGPPGTKGSPDAAEQGGDAVEDDNDYVELQTKEEEGHLKETPKELKHSAAVNNSTQEDNKRHSSDSGSSTEEFRSSALSEHCRLYFGALQKAIGGFVGSLHEGQPPEKFISQSKLVIMVGQRLVDTLCKEAQRSGSSQRLLCNSNHLCALLKQLAVSTKKAALHFPDEQALREVEEFAKELAQRAQHFRISLDL